MKETKPMTSRRQALALAGVLAATVFTGGAAIVGIEHAPSRGQTAQAPIVQVAQPQQAYAEEGD